VRRLIVACLACLLPVTLRCAVRGAEPEALGLVPRPATIAYAGSCAGPATAAVLAALQAGRVDPGGLALVAERWRALGIVPAVAGPSRAPAVRAVRLVWRVGGPGAPTGREAYRLAVDARAVVIAAADAEGGFDALMTLAQLARRPGQRSLPCVRIADAPATLAQLPRPAARGWTLPCVDIADAPALRWRILSDDVSRGPLPTMRYFEERIRTIAAFKMNGYSPYMEHVFVDPRHPLPAPLDGITPAQLRALDAYARRFHVALVPEQQTFAHMHGTLSYERYADLAETPHGYLLSPANPGGEAYARDLIAGELAAVPHPPFFHIGSDEPSDLGRGRAAALVAAQGDGPVYAAHVASLASYVIAHGGGRPLVWDDALARHPELFGLVPKQLVFVNWHYGSEQSYQPYIDRIARGGFDQLVAPGALNWNEIYPDLDAALANIDRFVTEGKASRVLGLFQTVWHDDGETLFEATWYPVVYAAASAWETGSVDRARYARDFPIAFFGSADPGYAGDMAALGRCRTLLAKNPREYGDYLFWADPFAPDLAGVPAAIDLRALRLAAEGAMTHLRLAPPPALHPEAAAVMALAARRYDVLGREYQIAREAADYYDGAKADLEAKRADYVYRRLLVTKYLFWEQRDAMLGLEPLVRAAWEYENRPGHEESVLERYHLAADRAIERADRLSDIVYRDYLGSSTLPPFEDVVGKP
jgi:hypothetical protein